MKDKYELERKRDEWELSHPTEIRVYRSPISPLSPLGSEIYEEYHNKEIEVREARRKLPIWKKITILDVIGTLILLGVVYFIIWVYIMNLLVAMEVATGFPPFHDIAIWGTSLSLIPWAWFACELYKLAR